MGIGIGLIFSLIFAAIAAVLAVIRGKNWGAAAAVAFILTFFLVLMEDWAVHTRPMMTFSGLLPLVLLNIATVMLVCWIADGAAQSVSAGTVVPLIVLLVAGGVWINGHGSGHGLVACPSANSGIGSNGQHCPVEAYGIVRVNENPPGTLPASVTTNLVVVTPDEAYTRASQAMSSGLAGTLGFASYLHLGPATLQRVNGHMWYAFPLEGKLHGKSPGYIMVSGENPGGPGTVIERYAPQYPNASMTVILGGGQGSEPDRWARTHGYSGYLLDNPTLEIPDGCGPDGTAQLCDPVPYYSVTLLRPQVGWTFFAPVGVLLINAHTGQVTRYALPGRTAAAGGGYPPLPVWVDRVYSQSMAATIGDWYGENSRRAWGGTGYTNRFTVSGDPVLVYTGAENPSWRMLLTSHGSDVSTYRILEMNSATGSIQVYTPAGPMATETSVGSAFCNAQGVGANGQGSGAVNVRSSHLVPEAMTLHEIYGQLTWMVSYEPGTGTTSGSAPAQQEGDQGDPCGTGEPPVANPTFTAVGFVSAYNVSGSAVAAGNSRDAALANYQQQLAQGSSAGTQPGAGVSTVTRTGTVCGKASDTSGGNETYYLTLCGPGGKPDYAVVYTGTSQLGPAIVLAQPGDPVTLTVNKFTAAASSQQIGAFSDARHPVSAGS
jgi:hypothetical protein